MLPRPTLVFFIAGGLAHDSFLRCFVARVCHVTFTSCWCRTFHGPPLDVAVGHASFRYRSSKFWWELVVLLRKYSIIMLVTFNSKGEYQLHMALGIVMVALHLHDSQRPFGHRHVNPTNAVLHRYEMGSLLTLLVMLWCGGFFSLNLCQTENDWCEFMVVVVLVCIGGCVDDTLCQRLLQTTSFG